VCGEDGGAAPQIVFDKMKNLKKKKKRVTVTAAGGGGVNKEKAH